MDIHFFNKDTGIVTGGVGTFFSNSNNACVLYTSNGGDNVYTSDRGKEWGWKFSFLNARTGYCVIESWRMKDTVGYLKTTNGGLNWAITRFKIADTSYHAQGILFNNEMTGWIGGYKNSGGGSTTNGNTYGTTDGGGSWQALSFGFNVNRFRKLHDSLIYAAGRTIYKYSPKHVSITPISSVIPGEFNLKQNYPNPFNPATKIDLDIPANNNNIVTVKIFNILGKEISRPLNERLKAGKYSLWFDGNDLPGGIYFYEMNAGNYRSVKKWL